MCSALISIVLKVFEANTRIFFRKWQTLRNINPQIRTADPKASLLDVGNGLCRQPQGVALHSGMGAIY